VITFQWRTLNTKKTGMRQVLTRVLGVGLVAGAIYAGWVKLPAAYPFVFRETGVAVVTRRDVNGLA
jgi:hypothetical protein